MENLRYASQTKVILEVIQKNSTGITLRLWEALTFNKYFVTNNMAFADNSYFDSSRMQVYGNTNDIVTEECFKELPPVSQEILSGLSPVSLLKYIDNLLSSSDNNK